MPDFRATAAMPAEPPSAAFLRAADYAAAFFRQPPIYFVSPQFRFSLLTRYATPPLRRAMLPPLRPRFDFAAPLPLMLPLLSFAITPCCQSFFRHFCRLIRIDYCIRHFLDYI